MTHDEKKKLYAALAAPFPENAIQRSEGRITGRGDDTTGIGYQFICNRLNEVLGVGGWRAHRTVTVKEITTAKGRPAYEAICDLTHELGSWESGHFVVFAKALSDGGHTSMSEADAMCPRKYELHYIRGSCSAAPSTAPSPPTTARARPPASRSGGTSCSTSSETPCRLSRCFVIHRRLLLGLAPRRAADAGGPTR